MVTINDIAKIANVSASTVSRVLNGKGRISEAKKKEILKIADELSYVPNYHAKCMIKENVFTIGFIAPDITNPFFAEVTKGIESALLNKALLILADSFRDFRREKEMAEMFKENGVKGIIFGNSRIEDDFVEYISKFLPVVIFDKEYKSNKIASVLLDNRYGAFMATKHLLNNGCQKVVHFGGTDELLVSVQRAEGYKEAMKQAGLDSEILEVGYDEKKGYEKMKEMLEKSERMDGVFCVNDLVALGVIRALKEKGVRIPQDVAIVGFDDTNLCNYVSPPLTSIRQSAEEMGKVAAKILMELINGSSTIRRYVFSPTLVVRQSSCRSVSKKQ